MIKIDKLVEDFHVAMNARCSDYIIERSDVLFNFMRNLGLNEEQLNVWLGHRRRLVNTWQTLTDILQDRKFETIVDVGTNFIFLPIWKHLRPESRLILGIDEEQSKFLHSNGIDHEAYFIDFELEPIPLPDNSVDLVTMFEVFEHFYIDPMYAISEINRILKDDGLFLMSAPNSTSWRSCLAALTQYHPYQYPVYAGPGSRRHVHEPTPSDFQKVMDAAGFEANVWTQDNFSEKMPASFIEFFKQIGVSDYNRGDTVFALGVKKSGVKDRYPDGLYDKSAMSASGL